MWNDMRIVGEHVEVDFDTEEDRDRWGRAFEQETTILRVSPKPKTKEVGSMPIKGRCPACSVPVDKAIYWVDSRGDLNYFCPACGAQGAIQIEK